MRIGSRCSSGRRSMAGRLDRCAGWKVDRSVVRRLWASSVVVVPGWAVAAGENFRPTGAGGTGETCQRLLTTWLDKSAIRADLAIPLP